MWCLCYAIYIHQLQKLVYPEPSLSFISFNLAIETDSTGFSSPDLSKSYLEIQVHIILSCFLSEK